jgi:YbbR domain-containing protein
VNWIFHNFAWKVLSVIVAFGLWFMVMSSNNIEITKEVDLELLMPPGLTIANEVPGKVTFRLAGSKFFLRAVASSLDVIRVDLTKAKAGPAVYRFDRDTVNFPIGVKVLAVSPTSIHPVLEPVERRSVPVDVRLANNVPSGYRLIKAVAVPKNVRIRGPKQIVEKVSSIRTPMIDLTDIPPSLKWDVPFDTGIMNVRFEEDQEPKVMIEVEPTGSNFRVAGVPVRVDASSQRFSLDVDKVALYVNCPPALIRGLTPDKVKAYVHFDGSRPGTYVREVQVDLPKGVRLVKVVPQKVQIKVLE